MLAYVVPIVAAMIFVTFRRITCGWREAVLAAGCCAGVLVVAITELLSCVAALRPWPVAIAWMVSAGGVLAATRCVTATPMRASTARSKLATFERFLVAAMAALLIVIAFTAAVAAPNTWDSLTYHLARTEHWRQAASVAYYPTSIPRQLYHPPLAEYAILHLRLLSGSNHFANFVQVAAMIGSIVAVSLVARQLGANRTGQGLAAALAVTLPSGVLQASGTQNNCVLAFWFVTLMYYALNVLQQQTVTRDSRRATIGVGVSLGLALMTKGTALLFAPPVLIGLTLGMFRSRPSRAIGGVVMIVVIAMAITLPHWNRNEHTFGSPFTDPADATSLRNESFAPRLVVANMVRHFATNASTGFKPVNQSINAAVAGLHQLMGVSINDPRTTTNGPFSLDSASASEDSAANPWHLLLVLSAAVVLWRKRSTYRAAGRSLFMLAGSAVLFAVVLKWQRYLPRLELPVFVAACAPLAVALQAIGRQRLTVGIMAALFLAAGTRAIANRTRPLVGRFSVLTHSREQQMFLGQPAALAAYRSVADTLATRHVGAIDLVCGGDDPEYRLWPMMAGRGYPDFVIRFAFVNNASAACHDPIGPGDRPLVLLQADQRATLRYLRSGWQEQDVGTLTIFWPPTSDVVPKSASAAGSIAGL